MTMTARVLFGSLCAAVMALAVAAAPAKLEKRLPLKPGVDLVVPWNAAWVVSTEMKGMPPDSLGFQLPKATSMRVALIPAGYLMAGEDPRVVLGARTSDLQAHLTKQGGEVSKDISVLEGGKSVGFYVTGVDANYKPGEFKYVLSGYVLVKPRVMVFSIFWNDDGAEAARKAQAAIADMRVEAS